MIIKPIKTRLVMPPKDALWEILEASLPELREKSIITITSKVVSICEGRCVPIANVSDKDELIKREADMYLPRNVVKNGWVMHTLTNNLFIPTAGIDESNARDHYVLWPKNPHASARRIYSWLKKRHKLTHIGVIITDSHSVPLRRGTVGLALAYYGFKPVHDYRQSPDLFKRELKISQSNIADGLAAAAVVCQGEGSEQTPLTLITDVPFVTFVQKPWKPKEKYASFEVLPEEDLYFPLLGKLPWKRSKKSRNER